MVLHIQQQHALRLLASGGKSATTAVVCVVVVRGTLYSLSKQPDITAAAAVLRATGQLVNIHADNDLPNVSYENKDIQHQNGTLQSRI